MFYTYILISVRDGTHYYGHSKDTNKRIQKHNQGKVRYTKARRPWNLVYQEQFETKSQAYKRELFFKSIEGYNYLKKKGII